MSRSEPDGETPESGPVQAPPGYRFPESSAGLLPWSHAEQRLQAARYYWLTTTRPDGRPHVTPLWGVWVARALFLDGSPKTRWARNLVVNPRASVHLESGSDVVIVEGVVEDLVTAPDLGTAVIDAWNIKYGRLAPNPAENGIFRFRPSTARAWSTETLEDGTRWRFPDQVRP